MFSDDKFKFPVTPTLPILSTYFFSYRFIVVAAAVVVVVIVSYNTYPL